MEVKNESSIQRAERFAQVLEGDQDRSDAKVREKPENGQSCPIDVSARSTERRTRSSKQGQERESFSTRMSKEAWLRMRALLFLGLVLVNLALLVHLSEKALRFRKRWKDHKLLVNNHPEMKSVDPEQGLLAFESDDLIRAFVLDNEEPGISEPFYVSDHESSDHESDE